MNERAMAQILERYPEPSTHREVIARHLYATVHADYRGKVLFLLDWEDLAPKTQARWLAAADSVLRLTAPLLKRIETLRSRARKDHDGVCDCPACPNNGGGS